MAARKEMKTKIVMTDYQNKPVMNIFELREDGATKDYALLKFGRQKAKAIMQNIEAIKKFASEKNEN